MRQIIVLLFGAALRFRVWCRKLRDIAGKQKTKEMGNIIPFRRKREP